MATTTPNYGWPVPTSTDYVKDGATAIEALGDAIDATVFGLPSAGLTLVKTQTIGSAVSSVSVTSAFSTTYDSYRVIVIGGVASADVNLNMTLTGSTASYYCAGQETTYTGSSAGAGSNNLAAWGAVGRANTNYINLDVEFIAPALAQYTRMASRFISTAGQLPQLGVHQVATAYTGFTFTTSAGTLTGGTIYVYGYQK
jgi:hypothetical protein